MGGGNVSCMRNRIRNAVLFVLFASIGIVGLFFVFRLVG